MLSRKLTGIVFVALIASAPIAHLLLGSVKSIAVPAWPPFQAEHYGSGVAMRFSEIWFDEATPASAWLRGERRNLWWQLGLFESEQVHIGKHGWLFAERTLRMNGAAFERAAAGRRAFLGSLRKRCKSLDVELLAVPVPDKSSVYTDWLASAEARDPAKALLYDRILTEFEAARIPTVDLGKVFGAPERDAPVVDGRQVPIDSYYQRDTHWDPWGMTRAARAIAEQLREAGFEDRFEAPATYDAGSDFRGVSGLLPDERLPDLVLMLGLPSGGRIEQGLSHAKYWMTLTIDGETCERRQPTASLAVCGDSFAFKGLFWPLARETSQLVDSIGSVPARGPFFGLVDTLDRIEKGQLQAKVLVWAFVERSYLHDWMNPPSLD